MPPSVARDCDRTVDLPRPRRPRLVRTLRLERHRNGWLSLESVPASLGWLRHGGPVILDVGNVADFDAGLPEYLARLLAGCDVDVRGAGRALEDFMQSFEAETVGYLDVEVGCG